MLTPGGLVIGLVLASPALWQAATGSLGLVPALLRLVAALALVAVGTAIMRRVMAPPRPVAPRPGDEVHTSAEHPGRRRDDA